MEFPKFIAILGIILAIIGFFVAFLSLFELNTNLSIFPTPKTNSELITTGFYKWSRHPIYSGILLFTLGYAFYSYSWYRLIIFGCLLIWFYLKSSYEEQQLVKKFKDYPKYQQKVGRFFPKIK